MSQNWIAKIVQIIWLETPIDTDNTTYRSDGKSWEPKPYSRICSQHFVGNKKSNHPHNPAFIPTIFPEVRAN